MALIKKYADTAEGKAQRLRDRFEQGNTAILGQLVQVYTQGFNQLWRNPFGLTPQEAFNVLGADAIPYLQAAEHIGLAIAAVDMESAQKLPTAQALGKKVTVKQDGSGVLVEDIV